MSDEIRIRAVAGIQPIKYEESYWCQKFRVTWLKTGERNTKFFHQTTVARRRNSIITRLKIDHGEWIDNEQEPAEMAKKFYENLYKAGQGSPVDEGNF